MKITDMFFSKIAATRLVREMRNGNIDLISDPAKTEEFNRRYSGANNQVDPLAKRLSEAVASGKVKAKNQTAASMANGFIHENTKHRDLLKRMGEGFEGDADLVLTNKGGISIRKSFRNPLSDVKDRYLHMSSYPDLYPTMHGYSGDQKTPSKLNRRLLPETVRENPITTRPSLFMEYVHGNDIKDIPKAQGRRDAFRQIADKLHAHGFQHNQSWDKVGPGESFWNPKTLEKIDDLHGGNIRVRPNGKAIILDPIQNLGVNSLREAVPIDRNEVFKYQRGWDPSIKSRPQMSSGNSVSALLQKVFGKHQNNAASGPAQPSAKARSLSPAVSTGNLFSSNPHIKQYPQIPQHNGRFGRFQDKIDQFNVKGKMDKFLDKNINKVDNGLYQINGLRKNIGNNVGKALGNGLNRVRGLFRR